MPKHRFTQVPQENPQYLISDNANNLVRSITDSGFLRHADISHSFVPYSSKFMESILSLWNLPRS